MSSKILHVFSVSFSISYFVGDQFNYLSKKNGNEYYVCCSPSDDVNKLAKKYSFIPKTVVIKRAIDFFSDIKAIINVYTIIKKNGIEKVVGHSPKGGMISMIAASIAGVKERIYFRHGIFYETSSGFKRKILLNIDRLSGTLATKVVCVSNAVKSISEKDNLNKKQKNIVLGLGTCSGVDSEGKFNPNNYSQEQINALKSSLDIAADDFVVGFVGRIVKDKGINELVEAWHILSKEYKNIKLLLVGPIEVRDPISDKTMLIINEDPSIIHVGNVSDTSLYYLGMDVFILPTYREGFPTVILEASSMKRPILVTKATGCEESIIENETGIFISHNSNDIAQKIKHYIDNPNEKLSHGNKGRKFISDNFEQTKIWDIIYEKLRI